ncbi:MAG: hypothetical protein A2V62_13350 [Nitrospirae bacterium RBG_19FT_COMBO_58_9]|nr:MAG: hypothetical protein A2V62_13350 [Nitrospirae bacterium RBG_19FT_COMBO_58_9]
MDGRLSILPVACALLALTACAKPPTEQIEAADKAVKEAQASGASTYTPDEYAKIEGTLAALKKEETEQEGKLALFRDYGKVEQLAMTAKTEAERIKTEATKKKEEAKAAALQAQQVAQEAVKATLELVAKAPAGKDRAGLESIKADAEALKASLNQVQMAIDTADYPAAQTKAKAIHEKSSAVSQEIEAALAKIGKGKPSAGRKK